jgi:hypothetical protein
LLNAEKSIQRTGVEWWWWWRIVKRKYDSRM